MPDEITPAKRRERRDLLCWYDRHRRDLPWRRDRDPYRVWVSEIMLQQTRVATAAPYFEAFLERFPTVETLAAAEVDDVLAAWSGLGYYRRARQMHAAAIALSAGVLPGEFPRTAADLQMLPGIGPYTAAAIASICFGEAVPVLDGNVERVLARRAALRAELGRAATRRRLLADAGRLLDPERPGDSNQALMELGATVCTPRSPRCADCPLAAGCRGKNEPERYPRSRTRRPKVDETRAVAVVVQRGAVLLFRRRSDDDSMAGLWELPQIEFSRSGRDADFALALAENYGGAWRVEQEVCRLRHTITHRSITLCVHPATLEDIGELAEADRRPQAAWVRWQEESHRYATSSMVGKVLDSLADQTGKGWPSALPI